jgi:hypothetical protein
MLGSSQFRLMRFDARVLAALLAVALQTACALDNRELLQDDVVAGSGGGGNVGGGTAGTDSGRAPGWDAPFPPDCVYAGHSIDAGCETLVSNPGFDRNADGWPPQQSTVSVGWSEQDRMESPSSGSIAVDSTLFNEEVKNGQVILGALQCVGTIAGGVYDIRADAFILPDQTTEGSAGLIAQFYKNSNCSAGIAGSDQSYSAKFIVDVGEWTPISGRFQVPADVGSMQVMLVVGKQFAPRSFKALFDNVLVQPK